ncbi:putative reverse transcriptase domain-containing protein [Tanacetum coccineum]
MFSLVWIMPPRVMTRSVGRLAAESRGWGMGGRVGRAGGRGRGPRIGNDERVNEPDGQRNDQSFVGKALTWWNPHIHTRSQEIVVAMSWDDFKVLTREEFCPSNEMQKLETKLRKHAMVEAGHVAYSDKFHKIDGLV